MMSAAAGSAHHHPAQVFRPTPSNVAAEVNAQKAVSAGVGDQGAVAERAPGAALGHRQARHDDQRSPSHRQARRGLPGAGVGDQVAYALNSEV